MGQLAYDTPTPSPCSHSQGQGQPLIPLTQTLQHLQTLPPTSLKTYFETLLRSMTPLAKQSLYQMIRISLMEDGRPDPSNGGLFAWRGGSSSEGGFSNVWSEEEILCGFVGGMRDRERENSSNRGNTGRETAIRPELRMFFPFAANGDRSGAYVDSLRDISTRAAMRLLDARNDGNSSRDGRDNSSRHGRDQSSRVDGDATQSWGEDGGWGENDDSEMMNVGNPLRRTGARIWRAETVRRVEPVRTVRNERITRNDTTNNTTTNDSPNDNNTTTQSPPQRTDFRTEALRRFEAFANRLTERRNTINPNQNQGQNQNQNQQNTGGANEFQRQRTGWERRHGGFRINRGIWAGGRDGNGGDEMSTTPLSGNDDDGEVWHGDGR